MKRSIMSFWLLILILCLLTVKTMADVITVDGRSGPWQWAYGGLNAAYAYGVNDQASPAVVTAISGSDLAPGQHITVKYVSGTVSSGAGLPFTDANGDTSFFNPPPSNNGAFPSWYIPGSAYYMELVGTFADSTGKIVGTPFAVGNGPKELVVPDGASRLQLGANDNFYGHNDPNVGSWTISITNALAAPTNLTVTPISSTKLDLVWQDPNNGNENGFKIERKTGNNPYTEITSVGPTPTTYHDTSLTPNTTYTYRVRAYQGSNFSDYSNEASGQTESLLVDEIRLGLPRFIKDGPGSYHLSVKVWMKGSGSGHYSGSWQRDHVEIAPVPSQPNGDLPSIDLSSGGWEETQDADLPATTLPWINAQGNYTLRFESVDPVDKPTADMAAAVTGFNPDGSYQYGNAWWFPNSFNSIVQNRNGLCLGMCITARGFYRLGQPLPRSWSFRRLYLLLYGTHLSGNAWALTHDDGTLQAPARWQRYSNAVQAEIAETDRIYIRLQSLDPCVVLMDSNWPAGIPNAHAILAIAGFFSPEIYDDNIGQEASSVKLFGVYNPNDPYRGFNHIYRAGPPSVLTLNYLERNFSPGLFSHLIEYTGPNGP